MYEYRQIILHMREGISDRQLERKKLIGRVKAKILREKIKSYGWLDKNKPLPDDEKLAEVLLPVVKKTRAHAKVGPFEERIKQWAEEGISATIIYHTLVEQYSFNGGYDCVRRFVQKIKKENVSVTMILDFLPGEYAQVDFGQGPKIYDTESRKEVKTWFFVMTLCWSRHQYAEIVTNQSIETWLGCHKRAFEWFNGVPSKMTIDNLKSAITKACYYEPTIQRSYGEYAEGYGFIISPCPVADPKKKGRVESGVKYIKINFLPLRKFRDIADANQQLKSWILKTAGNRKHGSTYQKPLTRFEEIEKILLKPLPKAPPECSTWAKVLVYRDCHIRFAKCKYSAPYKLVGKELWCRATETSVRLYQDHALVAIHPRLFTPGKRNTLEQHLAPEAQAYLTHDADWCLKQAQATGLHCTKVIENLLNNKVVDYLRSAQGIMRLKEKYGKSRLEAACQRALAYQTPTYKSIKLILSKGLEYAALPTKDAFNQLADIYLGYSKFCRSKKELVH